MSTVGDGNIDHQALKNLLVAYADGELFPEEQGQGCWYIPAHQCKPIFLK